MVGYALLTLRQDEEVIHWLADWRERLAAQPWMLWNGVMALRTQKREREAYEVSQHALQLPPDHVSAAHGVWVALDDALMGDAESAAEQLRGLDYDGLPEWQQFEFETATAVIDFARAQQNQLSTGVKQLLKLGRLRNTQRFFWRSKALYRAHQRALRLATASENVFIKSCAFTMLGWLAIKWAFLRSES